MSCKTIAYRNNFPSMYLQRIDNIAKYIEKIYSGNVKVKGNIHTGHPSSLHDHNEYL